MTVPVYNLFLVFNAFFCQNLYSLQVFVGLVGVIGNSLCLVAFSVKKNKSNFHYLMVATAVFDILYIFSASTLFSVPHIIPR